MYNSLKFCLIDDWTYLLTYSSSFRKEHKASTAALQRGRSLTMACAVPHERLMSTSSFVTVLRQVVLGRPRFLFPVGVHLMAVFGVRWFSMRRTWPTHLRRRLFISVQMLWQFVLLYRSALDMTFGQYIPQMRRRHPLWKAFSLFVSDCILLQHSELYRRTDLTRLL